MCVSLLFGVFLFCVWVSQKYAKTKCMSYTLLLLDYLIEIDEEIKANLQWYAKT